LNSREARRSAERRIAKAIAHAERRLNISRQKGHTMIINFNTPIVDLDNKPIPLKTSLDDVATVLLKAGIKPRAIQNLLEGFPAFMDDKDPEHEDFTVGIFVSMQLAAQDKEADLIESDERVVLARRLRKADAPVEVDKKDIERIEKAVAKSDLPLYKAAVRQLIEAARNAEKAASEKPQKPSKK
jgi:CRP-like cAMP-binding protein